MAGNVNARFGHNLDGERVDIAGGFRAGALDVGEVAERGTQKTFADVAAARIARAEDENERLVFSFHWGAERCWRGSNPRARKCSRTRRRLRPASERSNKSRGLEVASKPARVRASG